MPNRPPFVIDTVRAALATYQWTDRHCLMKFANSIRHSESQVRTALYQLIELGEVEQIKKGKTSHGIARIIYQLKLPQSVEKND